MNASYDVTSDRPYIRPSVRNPTMLMRSCLFGGELHRQLRLTKQKENLKTIKYKINLCDQQQKKEQDD